MDCFLRLAIPTPLRRLFDYLPPDGCELASLKPGVRVRVPFGRGTTIGILHSVVGHTEVPAQKLRAAQAIIDPEPVLPAPLFQLLCWAGDYYHHPLGEVLNHALPAWLREGREARVDGVETWSLSEAGRKLEAAATARAPRQAALLKALEAGPRDTGQLNALMDHWREPMRRMEDKQWVSRAMRPCLQRHEAAVGDSPPVLNEEQHSAVQAMGGRLGDFQVGLLEGVTGSGKTEVYLRLIEQVLDRGEQALVLVPEIGLTPQLLERFRRRFAVPIAVLHSGLTDQERLCAWLAARDGEALIVIGTRSAVFTPLARPGLIVVDEEHDPSFKQQEGFRYNARDLAIKRASDEGLPVLLGSATPSLESLSHARSGRYLQLVLSRRAGAARAPELQLLDVRSLPLEQGLSAPLLAAMRQHLGRGEQVMLFLNRRGYAPVLLCHDCGWVSHCRRCDAHLTFYQGHKRMRCHHCGAEQAVPSACPSCGSIDLRDVGQGTEKVEQGLKQAFPEQTVLRIDRDSTRRKGSLDGLLAQARDGSANILLGTQMLAKGHHFPGVTLVAILDADQGLFSADFRAAERMAQMIVQVAGRAGRAERPGRVLIQTHHPDHPLLLHLIREGYDGFAAAALAERQEAQLPPFAHLVLLRAESTDASAPLQFLHQALELCRQLDPQDVELWGPVPAPMERRAGRFRAQLLLQCPQRAPLHRLLKQLAPQLEGLKSARKVRWSLDVDPMDMF